MYEEDLGNMQQQLLEFRLKYGRFVDFMQYFERTWVNNDWIKCWAAGYQLDIHTNMETNNFVESWHNQLETFFIVILIVGWIGWFISLSPTSKMSISRVSHALCHD